MNSDQSRQPSIRDVARVAGVAHQTVSRVLNDFPSISPETRQKVLAAVSEVGYRPNAAARALVSRRSRTIGVLASSIIHHGPASSIAEIERSALDHGYRLSITSFDETDPTSASKALDFLLSQRVEALAIITPVNAALDTVRAAALRIPVIFLEPLQSSDATTLAYDQSRGIGAAARHLINLGHQRILHVSGPDGSVESDVRTAGFAEEITAAGLPLLAGREGNWTASMGYTIGMEILPDRDFTGIIAANDQTAIGLLHACRQLGVRVPEDLSIVGFDDIPEAEHLAPALTTVRQDFARIGRRAMRSLLDELERGVPMTPQLLHPELIVRESTATPPPLSSTP